LIPSATHDFRAAWRLFKFRWRVLCCAVLALFATWALLEIIVIGVSLSAASLNLTVFGATINVILHLGFLVIFSGLLLGLHRIALDIVEGGDPSLSLLTYSIADGPAYLLALTLYWTMVAAGMLMVVPGVFVAVRYAFFGQILASKPISALAALREAASLAENRWRALFSLFLIAAALNLAGACLLGIGLMVSYPVTLLATTQRFCSLRREAEL